MHKNYIIELNKCIFITLCLFMSAAFAACTPHYLTTYAPVVPSQATAAYLRAAILREEGQYAEALIYYDQALRIGGEEPELRATRNEVAQLAKKTAQNSDNFDIIVPK